MIHEYAQKIRRQIHMYPELGYELPRTLALLRSELDAIGVEYTEKYGKSSIVATINPDKKQYTIGIRADMDALPITVEVESEYQSRIPGQMHACGHDVHTAVALATLRELYDEREQINCCVKFLFQPAEETTCGAKPMVDDGVMDDIDISVALHTSVEYPVGTVAIGAGPQSANSDRLVLEFFGKNSHVASQQLGVDAIMMAIRAYTNIEFMIAKEVSGKEPVVFNAGQFNGGTAANIIADYCKLVCTLRTWNDGPEEYIIKQIQEIGQKTAEMCHGSFRFTQIAHYPSLPNDADVTEKLRQAAIRTLGAENVLPKENRSMGGEDYAYFARVKPGSMFRLGVGNKEKGITSKNHNPKFAVDENCLDVGVRVFKQFVYDNMNNER